MLARDEDILETRRGLEEGRARRRARHRGRDLGLCAAADRLVTSSIDDQGYFLGSVWGGCVEGAVVTEAIDVIDSGKPKTLEFGVADETAWKVGLSCGGKIRVFVEKVE